MEIGSAPIVIMILTLILAGLSQGLAGFGSGLVSMPILAVTLGPTVAVPLFALVAIVLEIVMMLRYWGSLTFRSVWRLMVAGLIAIPIGIFGSPYIGERVTLVILGLVVLGFGLFGLFSPRLPRLENPRWGYAFGFAAGLLSGAYNTGGPSYVIYGTTQGWSPREFKANLQGAFIVGSVMLILMHSLRGNYTLQILRLSVVAIPAMLVGLFVGFSLDRFIRPEVFRRVVQVLLVVLGFSLITRSLG